MDKYDRYPSNYEAGLMTKYDLGCQFIKIWIGVPIF